MDLVELLGVLLVELLKLSGGHLHVLDQLVPKLVRQDDVCDDIGDVGGSHPALGGAALERLPTARLLGQLIDAGVHLPTGDLHVFAFGGLGQQFPPHERGQLLALEAGAVGLNLPLGALVLRPALHELLQFAGRDALVSDSGCGTGPRGVALTTGRESEQAGSGQGGEASGPPGSACHGCPSDAVDVRGTGYARVRRARWRFRRRPHAVSLTSLTSLTALTAASCRAVSNRVRHHSSNAVSRTGDPPIRAVIGLGTRMVRVGALTTDRG